MCFSPEASFIVSAGIAITGVLALRKTTQKREWLLASIPLLFAGQQFVEGLLWLVMMNGEMPLAQHWLTQIYGSYAGVIWPVIVPLSIMFVEDDRVRKYLMMLIFIIGLATVFSTMDIIATGGFSSVVQNNCILYDYSQPINTYYATKWSYLVAISGAFFLSSQPVIRWLGAVNVITFSIAYYIYNVNYISVWCFFAAITSGLIYFYFREKQIKQLGLSE